MWEVIIMAVLLGAGLAHAREDAGQGGALSGGFIRRYGDPDLLMPGKDGEAAVASRDTRYARFDSDHWQRCVLREPFHSGPALGERPVSEIGAGYRAARSPAGFDSIYHSWRAGGYRLQFKSTEGEFQLAVARRQTDGGRSSLAEVVADTRALVSSLIRHGDQLVALGRIRASRMRYGYLIMFRVGQAARRELTAALRRADAPPGALPGYVWIYRMTIATDGSSFLLRIPKTGPGPVRRRNVKTWFD